MPTTPFFPKYRDREYLIVALIDRAGSNIFPSKDALAATTFFTSIFEGRRKRIGVIVIDRLAYESFDNDLFKTRSKLTILRHELGHVIGYSHSKGMNLMNARVLAIPLNLLQTSWPKVASIPSRCGKR